MLRTFMVRGIGIGAAAAFVAVASAGVRAAGQDPALVEKGKALYATQKCSMCHSIGGVGKKTSPLDGVGGRLSAEDIRQWFTDPVAAAAKHKSTKKPLMPAKFGKLPPADLDALVAYMQSLK
jgi:mono/diheme cytochrome c family protein